jgi:hypothetical protein
MLIGTKQKPIKVFDFIGNFITSNEIKIRYTWFEYEGHSCIMTLKKALICENHIGLVIMGIKRNFILLD